MTKSKSAIALLIGGGLTLGMGMMAFAGPDRDGTGDQEHAAFQAAPIGLAQAISTAESQSGGRAMSAEFETEDGSGVFEVELLAADGTEIEILVDASTGQVVIVHDDNDKMEEKD